MWNTLCWSGCTCEDISTYKEAKGIEEAAEDCLSAGSQSRKREKWGTAVFFSANNCQPALYLIAGEKWAARPPS